MEMRTLGRTGLKVSVLTFGCGAVGGLMTKGEPADQERAFAMALERGINIFDTAPLYGNGASETNVGRILAKLKPDIVLGTKVRILAADREDIAGKVARSIDESLSRLGRDHVDVLQLHNVLFADGHGDGLSADLVLTEVLPALQRVQRAGKTRFIGITALGETSEIDRVLASGAFDTGQICYNVLNPTAGAAMPAGYPAQDYDRLMTRAAQAGTGTIGIRVLAGGALSGTTERHPLGMPVVPPIGSGADYARDVARALRFQPMIAEGHVGSLPELALRFAISQPALSTTQIGLATLEQLETAIAAVEKGPLPAASLKRVGEIQASFIGEPR